MREAGVTDPQDKLLLAGAPARVAWPTTDLEDQSIVLATAFGITQSMTDVLLEAPADASPALRLADIEGLVGTLPPAPARAAIDTTDLAATLGQRQVQTFSSNARWRMSFDTDTLTGTPQAFDLALTYGSAEPSDTSWLMSVFLNDRLIHAYRHTRAQAAGRSGSLAQERCEPANSRANRYV